MRLLLVGSLLVLVGCGGDDDGPGPAATPASISLSASTNGTINALNATRTLTATVRDANQATIGNASVGWTVAPAGVVTLSSASGLTTTLTAVGSGDATITAQSGTVTATHDVSVEQEFASLELTPNPGTVSVAGTLQLVATGKDPGGSALPSIGTVTYTSSDVSKATVDANGLVSGVAAGDVDITAEATVNAVTQTATAALTVGTPTFPLAADVVAGNTTQTFTPPSVDIADGGTVTWSFGQLGHNVTFGAQAGAPTNIATSVNTTAPRTFNTPGTFNYNCTVHPGMSGTVIVH